MSGAATKLKLGGKIAELAVRVVAERIRGERPLSTSVIPRSAEALTPEWLTEALCGEHQGARVIGLEIAGGSDGSTSRRAIDVTYNEAGQLAGLPRRLYCKSTPGLTSRLIVGPTGALASEVGFYGVLRGQLDIAAPTSYFAVMDERSYRSMILMEDVAVSQGAEFGDPTTLAIDRFRAESMVTQMATYHAACWESSCLQSLPWLQTALGWQLNVNQMLPFERRSLIGFDRAEHVIPRELRPRKREIYPAFMRSLEQNARGPETFLHSDVHLGNWYATPTGMGQHDWQCATRGLWALDVAYALGSALAIEDRRAWERDLLALYVDRLARSGVANGPTVDEAFLAYRQQIFHGLVFWLFTIGASRMQPKMQPEHVSLANLERMTAAVVDNDSLSSAKASR